MFKAKLNTLRRELDKIKAADPRPAGSEWWFAVWRLEAIIDAVAVRIGRNAPLGLERAALIVLEREAKRLGASCSPDVVNARSELRKAIFFARLSKEFASFSCEDYQVMRRAAERAGFGAQAVVTEIWGVKWPGCLPPAPPLPRPVVTLPRWVSEITDDEVKATESEPTEQEWN